MCLGSCSIRGQSRNNIVLIDCLLTEQDPRHTLRQKSKVSTVFLMFSFSGFCPNFSVAKATLDLVLSVRLFICLPICVSVCIGILIKSHQSTLITNQL